MAVRFVFADGPKAAPFWRADMAAEAACEEEGVERDTEEKSERRNASSGCRVAGSWDAGGGAMAARGGLSACVSMNESTKEREHP